MAKRRTETWVALAVVAIGLIPVALAGLWGYMSMTATTLHRAPAEVPSQASAPSPGWTGAIAQGRQIVLSHLTERNLPGLSVAVGAGGNIVWAEGFGWADLDSHVRVGPETTFRIGTASKILTSAGVGLLLDQRRLRLDDVIQPYVPEFPEKEWPVTLRQLMGHIAGLGTDGGDEGPLYSQQCARPMEALPFFAGRPLLFEPGTQYRFSSYGWILVSAAVEAVADEPFLAFMQKRIFEPLGMRDTKADSATEPIASRATFYFPRFASDPRYGLHLMRPVDYSCYAGASAFLSTPSDLVRFGMAMQPGTLLQPATVQLLQTPQRLASGEETGYGLGWDVETVNIAGKPTRWAGHEGTTLGGPVAALVTIPEHGLVVSVISNISYADTTALAVSVADAFVSAAAGSLP